MITGIWGKKIGMTQVFVENKVVPVTVVDVSSWVITQVKTKDLDGYNALQVGCIKDKYQDAEFNVDWLKKLKTYFSTIKEVRLSEQEDMSQFAIGHAMDVQSVFTEGDKIDVRGTTKGHGFTGVVKRYGFAGARASHGAKMGKRPGSLSFMRSQGRVIKGKKLPGHMGTTTRMIQGLNVVQIRPEQKVVMLKGSVPGSSGSLVFIRKANA